MKIKKLILTLLFLYFMTCSSIAGKKGDKLFPFPVESYKLQNGMEVVLIKTGNDGSMMDLLVVDVGGRNEKKPDEIEYTHLMEHLMFRGTKNYSYKETEKICVKYGIYDQGFTEDDFTCYYRKFPAKAFEDLSKIMADKLENLSIPEDEYRAETGAVLGEFLGWAYSPIHKLYTTLGCLAYKVHPYRDVPEHLEVLKKMPDNMEAVMKFYRNYYRPDNCRLVVVGDFNTEDIKKIIDETYGKLLPGKVISEIPQEPPQEKELTENVEFDGKTSPYIIIAYRLPAYDINNSDIPALDLIKELYFSENSSIYKKLYYDEQIVTSIDFPGYYFKKDPGLFSTRLKLNKGEDIEKVKKIFLEEIEKIKSQQIDEKKLEEIKKKTKYDFLTGLDSLEGVGFSFMNYYFLSSNYNGVNIYFKNQSSITGKDIKKVMNKYFVPKNRIIVTLVEKGEKK